MACKKYSTQFYNMTCWHCGKVTSSDDGVKFACSHCGSLLALPNENIVSSPFQRIYDRKVGLIEGFLLYFTGLFSITWFRSEVQY